MSFGKSLRKLTRSISNFFNANAALADSKAEALAAECADRHYLLVKHIFDNLRRVLDPQPPTGFVPFALPASHRRPCDVGPCGASKPGDWLRDEPVKPAEPSKAHEPKDAETPDVSKDDDDFDGALKILGDIEWPGLKALAEAFRREYDRTKEQLAAVAAAEGGFVEVCS